ncbi:hypothetical protein COW36_18915 [bacterium (Candidatus Blackallbacteria) CG17_big_fil_post_rev_8_21_14_2_50_48_46]|uniref:AB hydrolase-1 domain-containing protein n=1 Tax=bacterium (Candidatus Blackallbacteria) CG17_big_fil_post_rev_8_21_14_2_50_48_46 TaxID=2014261 RepID=A0A2M7G007_9BACT|nr:MAG: hypothetical protein COW64_25555 [bacterium (Candidatus Blackallbacteria) CG18_big_fil_WC_8_21_14_2_50_49_26]PIW14999.1 MAG: hypothetical protein COW36_18915 [bacterium (Candidatus Blackallbacteria) CG17_big_fil_post_rev_8_21_14_2_50_48_46]PIW50080.1 MAG: hypothetical protein COW20_03850 [bacterium (Candidatus Blackallbacteria) CG13_big_fil_rev_8_21_14_2_50_49_14]
MTHPPFMAPVWLKTGHLQTAYSGIFWQPRPLPADTVHDIVVAEAVKLRCLLNRANPTPKTKLCILVHGLESSAEASYMVSAARKGLKRGWDILRVNLRGCGGTTHLSSTAYHAGLSQDVWKVAVFAYQSLGYSEIVLAGFSLGGHQVLKLASELEHPPEWLKGICAISPPLDLAETSRNLMRLENRGYERYFFQQMLKTFRWRRRLWPESTPEIAWSRLKNLKDIDNHLTAPAFGFLNGEDYYRKMSVGPHLNKIKIATQIVMAQDDPIIPFTCHAKAMKLHAQIKWLISPGGGHVGFINREFPEFPEDIYWAENRLFDFAEALADSI